MSDFVAPSVRGPWFEEGQRDVSGKVKLSDASPDDRHVYALRSYSIPRTGSIEIDTGVTALEGDAICLNEDNVATASRKDDIANQAWFGLYYDEGCTDLLGVVNRQGRFVSMRQGAYGNDELDYDTLSRIPFPVDRLYLRMLTAPLNHDLDRKVYEVDLDEKSPKAVIRIDGADVAKSTGYLKAVRHSTSARTTETNANFNLSGAIYGMYGSEEHAEDAVRTVMGLRQAKESEARTAREKSISPTGGYGVASGTQVIEDRASMERVRMSDVSAGLSEVLTSATIDGGSIDESDAGKGVGGTHYASTAWLQRGITGRDGVTDRMARGDYEVPTGDYYVTELVASEGYDPVSEKPNAVVPARVLASIDRAPSRVVAEIGGWRYELPETDSEVFVGLALEGSDKGMVEVPVAVSRDRDAVVMTRTRVAEANGRSSVGAGRHVETGGVYERDGEPFVIGNDTGDYYVSSITGVRADEYLPDTAAAGTTLVESDVDGGGYGVGHEEAARLVLASIPSVGYGRTIDGGHASVARRRRIDFECDLRPFPVYIQYVMATGSAISEQDVSIASQVPAGTPAASLDRLQQELVYNARYAQKGATAYSKAQIDAGDGNAFRTGEDETGSEMARVMPLEWPISDRRSAEHQVWRDRPYQIGVTFTDSDDERYDARLTRGYPLVWAWRRRDGNGNGRTYQSIDENRQTAPRAYEPLWLSLHDTPDGEAEAPEYTMVEADRDNVTTERPLDILSGVEAVKRRNAEGGIYPDYRGTEALPDWYPQDASGGPDYSKVIRVYEYYREVADEGVQGK